MTLQALETANAATETEPVEREPSADEAVVEEPPTLSKDVVFEILKNQRRRDTLWYLKEHEGTAKLSDLAEYIAAKENDIEIAALSSSQRKRVYIGLYQCHLPKMASNGIIDFEKNRGDIELRAAAAQLDEYLEDDEGSEERPRMISLALALAVGTGTLAGLAGVPLFALVPPAGWALVSTFALLCLTGLEVYHQYA